MAHAQSAWVLWRYFLPTDNPEVNDAPLWQAQPKTTTKEQCESEVKEYRALDPDKLLLDSTGRAYRIECFCVPDTVDRAGRRGSEASGTSSMRRCPAIGGAYPFPVIRANLSVPAPRPYPLALSGVETPVNLAFVEATDALGVADGVLETGPHRR